MDGLVQERRINEAEQEVISLLTQITQQMFQYGHTIHEITTSCNEYSQCHILSGCEH